MKQKELRSRSGAHAFQLSLLDTVCVVHDVCFRHAALCIHVRTCTCMHVRIGSKALIQMIVIYEGWLPFSQSSSDHKHSETPLRYCP